MLVAAWGEQPLLIMKCLLPSRGLGLVEVGTRELNICHKLSQEQLHLLARSYIHHSKHAAAFNFHPNLVPFKWQIQDLNAALWSLVSIV